MSEGVKTGLEIETGIIFSICRTLSTKDQIMTIRQNTGNLSCNKIKKDYQA